MRREKIDLLATKVIGLAIEVKKELGLGLLESSYEKALCFELSQVNINFNVELLKNGIKRKILT